MLQHVTSNSTSFYKLNIIIIKNKLRFEKLENLRNRRVEVDNAYFTFRMLS